MLRFFLILFVLALAAKAQDSGAPSNFLVRVWQSDEGLPGNVVRSIGQSTDGFLWIATAEGITRFDGTTFETIGATGAWQGQRLDFFRIFTPDDGSVWASTYRHGLFRVGKNGIEGVIDDFEGNETDLITRLFTQNGGTYFIRNQQLWRLDGNKARLADSSDAALNRKNAEEAIAAQRRGRADNSSAPAELLDREGGVWRTENRNLAYRPPGGESPGSSVPDFDGRMAAIDLLEDREGNLWIASPLQGLIRVRHRRVHLLSTQTGNYQSSAITGIQARDGSWWIGKRNGGVDRIRNGVVTPMKLSPSGLMRSVSCIFEDRSGRLWFASRDGSVFEWNPGTGDFDARFVDPDGFSKINVIAEDKDGRLWFGGKSGLYRWDGSQPASAVAGEAVCSTLGFSPDNELYAGSVDGRVFQMKGTELVLLGGAGSLLGKSVSSILPLANGEIWASTIGAGLFVWKDQRWHRFSSGDGLPDERLTALTLVAGDDLWMGSLGGILRASRKDLLDKIKNPDLTPHWLRLDRSDGLVTRECVGSAQPGVFRDREGGLWFPTTAGLAGVRPGQISASTIVPALRFHPVEINGVPHAADAGKIIAEPGRTHISLHFTGLSLSSPEKVSYRVQLIGLDESPRLIGTQREVDYQSVPPGRYRFEVSAMNGDGLAAAAPSLLEIEVRHHIWQTAWFRALVIIAGLLLALSIGWLIARRRMKRKIQDLRLRGMLEAERSRISSDLHDDLGASLTELSILSEIAAEDPDENSLRPSLSELSLKARRVVGTLDEIVWATNPTEDSLLSLIEYLTAFVREFLDAVQIPLRTQIERQIPDLAIGPRPRHNVLLATREAVNNAVKHANPRSIFLKITIDDGRLIVTIQDDGKGFAIDYAFAGDGLKNLKNRMTDCGGTCSIESTQGQGSTVTLSLPLPS